MRRLLAGLVLLKLALHLVANALGNYGYFRCGLAGRYPSSSTRA